MEIIDIEKFNDALHGRGWTDHADRLPGSAAPRGIRAERPRGNHASDPGCHAEMGNEL